MQSIPSVDTRWKLPRRCRWISSSAYRLKRSRGSLLAFHRRFPHDFQLCFPCLCFLKKEKKTKKNETIYTSFKITTYQKQFLEQKCDDDDDDGRWLNFSRYKACMKEGQKVKELFWLKKSFEISYISVWVILTYISSFKCPFTF